MLPRDRKVRPRFEVGEDRSESSLELQGKYLWDAPTPEDSAMQLQIYESSLNSTFQSPIFDIELCKIAPSPSFIS